MIFGPNESSWCNLFPQKCSSGRKIARIAPILMIFGPNESSRRDLFPEIFSKFYRVDAINLVQKSSKSELSSRFSGRLKFFSKNFHSVADGRFPCRIKSTASNGKGLLVQMSKTFYSAVKRSTPEEVRLRGAKFFEIFRKVFQSFSKFFVRALARKIFEK